jgi:DNA (cytosine-5)-methyltransferase 1
MTRRFRALDLYCGAGGASGGLHRAGFEVVGVDHVLQPRYPFEFRQADALTFDRSCFDFIWASPPCQAYTAMLNHGLSDRRRHPDLIDATRRRLSSAGLPYVIENVAGAPLRSPVMLCGEMFGLRVTRHRFFESNVSLAAPAHPRHKGKGHRKRGDGGYYLRVYGHETGKRLWPEAMGIDWMRTPELAQAIPPDFSEFLGRQVMALLAGRAERAA